MLSPESNFEFSKARQQAFIEEWLNFFARRSNNLLSFEDVRQSLRLQDSTYKGLQEIEVDKIVGSTGRYRDFTRTFLPKSNTTEERWRRIDTVAHEQGFPPIEVYKVGDVYFVRDGNHRVSVARTHGAKTIEAYVIEYKTPVPIGPQDDLDDILLRMERAEFLKETSLDQIRPEQNVFFTEPGRYRLIKEHIAFHKYLKETELNREISYEEAVGSWYDNVYMPLVELIRERDILKYFPGRTEADLYAWLILHRAALEAEMEALGQIPNEQIIKDLEKEGAPNPFLPLINFFQDRLNLQSMSLKAEQAKFLQETQLDKIRPEHNLQFTEPEGYQLVKEHIAFHKYLRETECNCEISYEEAVGSWYDNVYRPLVEVIREHDILKYFPGRTEADVYLWLILRRAACEAKMDTLGQIPDEKVIEDLEKETTPHSLVRLAQFFGFKPKPQSTLLPVIK